MVISCMGSEIRKLDPPQKLWKLVLHKNQAIHIICT